MRRFRLLCATSSSSWSCAPSLLPLSLRRPLSLARICLSSPAPSSTNSRASVNLSSCSLASSSLVVSCDRFSWPHGWGFGCPRRSSHNSLHKVLGRNSGVEYLAACAEEEKEGAGLLVQRMMSFEDGGVEEGLDHEGGRSLAMAGGVAWGPRVKSLAGAGGGGGGADVGGDGGGGRGGAATADDGEQENRGMEEKKRKREGEWFRLTDSCSLVLHQGDITKWSVDGETDAIVNAANEAMLGGGGVDGAIHRAAGPKLLEACYAVPEVSRGVRCPTGSAVITGGFNLPASRVIHTVGPIYESDEISAEPLAKAYRSSMTVATKAGVEYIAFPAISCGVYGYPYKEAAKIALATVQETSAGLLEVHFVLFLEHMWKVWLAEAGRHFERENAIDA